MISEIFSPCVLARERDNRTLLNFWICQLSARGSYFWKWLKVSNKILKLVEIFYFVIADRNQKVFQYVFDETNIKIGIYWSFEFSRISSAIS